MQMRVTEPAYRLSQYLAFQGVGSAAEVHLGEGMVLDPEIVAFAEESDRWFGPDYGRLPIGEQRRLYDAWCRHFSAPFPADVAQSEIQMSGPDGSVRAKLFRPSAAQGILPVIVFYHGGGWLLGSPETH